MVPPLCVVCGRPLRGGAEVCGNCARGQRHYDRCRSATVYTGAAREYIQRVKYLGAQSLGLQLGKLLAERAPTSLMRRVDLIVPVPLARDRLQLRGFNQAELLAAPVAQRWRLPLASGVVTREGNRAPQASLSGVARRYNLRGVFSVSLPGAVVGRHVLVIDDVLTTGATLSAVAFALLRAGAGCVSGLVFASSVTTADLAN